MKRLTKVLLLSSALGLAATGAQAQSWEGPYVGAYGAWVDSSDVYVGAVGGYNFYVGGGTYAGLEVDGMYDFTNDVYMISAQGRAAFEASPQVLLYAQAGVGTDGTSNWWLAGAGGEVEVMSNVSLRLGVDRYDEISGPGVNWAVKAGIGYHF